MPFSDRIAKSVMELIGDAPVIRLHRIEDKDSAEILAKSEGFNPSRSVKDRICLSMIEDAEKRPLKKGAQSLS